MHRSDKCTATKKFLNNLMQMGIKNGKEMVKIFQRRKQRKPKSWYWPQKAGSVHRSIAFTTENKLVTGFLSGQTGKFQLFTPLRKRKITH